MNWEPISVERVYEFILDTEKELNGELFNFWELIKIYPEKWTEETYGNEGGGFLGSWTDWQECDLVQ